MAKAKPKPAPAADPKRSGRSERKTIIVLKGTQDYQAWLDKAVEETHMPASVIIDVAVMKWAESVGLPKPPQRLGGR